MKTLLNKLVRNIAVLGITLSSFSPIKSNAKDIWVPTQKPTIQSAIDSAVDKDRIILHDGTYSGAGNYDIHWNATNKHLTIKSASGKPEKCIIDPNSEGRGFILNQGQTNQDIIDGVTIRRGKAKGSYDSSHSETSLDDLIGGAGVLMDNVSATLTNCIIKDCYAFENRYIPEGENDTGSYIVDGGGIDIINNSSSLIHNCIIDNNTSTHSGGGISVRGSSPTFDSCTITNNLAKACVGGGGIEFNYLSSGSVKNCLIFGNTAWFYSEGGYGGGISTSNSNPDIFNCTIINNSTIKENSFGLGGGMNIIGQPYPIIKDCIISDNDSTTTYKNLFFSGLLGDNLDMTYSLLREGLPEKVYSTQQSTIIDADPLLDANGKPKYGSPCIDSGTNTGINYDIDGNLRPQDGNNDGIAKYDMGCYELPLRNAVRSWKGYE